MNFPRSRPTWTYNWCYYFAVISVVAILTGMFGVFYIKQHGPVFVIVYMLAALVQAATAYTLFWMCRNSLRIAF